MTNIGTQPLETERLILRRCEVSDADAAFKNWCSDPEVTKYLMWQTHKNTDETKEIYEEWVNNYSDLGVYHWMIVPKELGEPIGSIAAVQRDDLSEKVHIGYVIGKTWWGKGYTAEALNALVRFFFEEVGVNRVESRHDPRNPNSGKVMMKAGLKYEGTLVQSDWNNSGICDAKYYAILKSEYNSKK